MAFNGNERLDARPGRAPCGEECQIAVADVAPDQEATGPKPRFRLVVFVGIEVGEFAIGPVMKPCAFGAFTGGKTLSCFRIEITGDLLRRAGDRRLSRPGSEVMIGFYTKNIAFTGTAQTTFYFPTPYTASPATHENGTSAASARCIISTASPGLVVKATSSGTWVAASLAGSPVQLLGKYSARSMKA